MTQQQIVEQAAAQNKIPAWVLWGVYGAETAHGQDVKPSSTGALGPFQFEPATAAEWGYPTTANINGITNLNVFAQQANVAGKYLAALFKEHGTWNAALLAYSGGGYGEAHVREQAGIDTTTSAGAAAAGAPTPATSAKSSSSGISSLLEGVAHKGALYVAFIVGGLAALAIGAKLLVSPPAATGAR